MLILILLPILGIFDKLFLYIWLFIVGGYVISDLTVSLYLAVSNDIFSLVKVKPLLSNCSYGDMNSRSNVENKFKLFKPSLFWRLLIVFPAMHFAWAFGFWRRLFQRPKPGQYWGY